MATIAVKPYVLRDMVLEIEADDYAAAISRAELAPSSSLLTFQGAKVDATFTDVSPATWAANLTYAQDWADPLSLSNYLMDHEGETVEATLRPQSGIGPSFEVDLVITPGAIGGDVGGFQTATVALGVSGRPVRVPAA